MDNAQLQVTFPYGALIIPRAESDYSFPAKVGSDSDSDGDLYFSVWDTPFHETELLRDMHQENDGWVTTSLSGAVYFLRPLTEHHAANF